MACKSNLSEFDDVQGHPGFDKQGTQFKRLIEVLLLGKHYYNKIGVTSIVLLE